MLDGQFSGIKSTHIAQATAVFAFWVERFGQPALDKLADSLRRHQERLEHEAAEEGRLREQELIHQAANGSAAPTAAEGGPAPLASAHPAESFDPATRWSREWTSEAIRGWAANLIERNDRGLYIYGARRSGKSVLIKSLCDELRAHHPASVHVSLNLKTLLRAFERKPDEHAFLQSVINDVARQVSPTLPPPILPEHPDFKDQMSRTLMPASDGPIYFVVNHCDAAARRPDPEMRRMCLDVTHHLYAFLGDAMEEEVSTPSNQVFVILEGRRHKSELQHLYPQSPSPFRAPLQVLRRLDWEQYQPLGRLAGMIQDDVKRSYDETRGHRSLLWPILAEAMRSPARLLPEDLGSLETLRHRLGELERDLILQPELSEAFQLGRMGRAIDSGHRQRLIDTMYLADTVPPRCDCPLLEAAIAVDAAAVPESVAGPVT